MECFQERVQMLLVFLISVDIKTDANSIARKSPAENSGFLCCSENGVLLSQGLSFAKTCGTADDIHNVLFGSGKHVRRKRIRA